MVCPKCGSENVDIQVQQEQKGSVTVSHANSKYREKGHGCLWWCLFGWWWWIIDLSLWVFCFIPRLILQLFKKKKYKGSTKSTSSTVNKIEYRRVCVCKDCGNLWMP